MSGYSLLPSIVANLTLLVHAVVEDTQSTDQSASGSEEAAAAGSQLLAQCISRIAGEGIDIKKVHPWKVLSGEVPIACTVTANNPGKLITLLYELSAIRLEQQIRAARLAPNPAKRYRVRIGQVGYVHSEGVAEVLPTRRFASDSRKRERADVDVPFVSPDTSSLCTVLIEGFLATIPVAENVSAQDIADRISNELKPNTFTQAMPQLAAQLQEVYGSSMTPINSAKVETASTQLFDSSPASLSACVFCDFITQTTLSRPTTDGGAEPVRALGRLMIAFNPFHGRASECAGHLRTLLNTTKTFNGNTVRANLVSTEQFLKIVKACGAK